MRAKTFVVAVLMAVLLALPGPMLAASSCSDDGGGTSLLDPGRPLNPVPNGQGLGPWPLLL
jgi:hypothetical protein